MHSNPTSFWRGWKDFGDFLRRYWTAYGGFWNLARSPYFHISLVLTGLSYGLWSKKDWWEVFLVTNPAILGFTIGGFALLLATGAEKFGAILAQARLYQKSGLESPLAKLGAAFVHFIFVQFLSIIYAILAKAADKTPTLAHFEFLEGETAHKILWAIGFFLGIYALVCAIATSEWIFRIVVLLVKFQKARYKLELEKAGSSTPPPPPEASEL